MLSDDKQQTKFNLSNGILFQSEEDIFIEVDWSRLIQVISNLLSNAIKFTKDGGGTITVTTEKKVTQAIVKVKDTGGVLA